MESRRRTFLGLLAALLATPFIAIRKAYGCESAAEEKKDLTAEDREILQKLKDGMTSIDTAVRKALADAGLKGKIDIGQITYFSIDELKKLHQKANKVYNPEAIPGCICQCCVNPPSYSCCYYPGCNPCG